ncbi:MAG: integrase [Ramlibacter sp.]|nr:integrase [Ramlibacter sp.]
MQNATSASQSKRKSSVKNYLHSSLSPNTTAAYASDLVRFKRWGGTVPATAQQVARYLAAAADSLKPSTLTRRVAAIAFAHAIKNLPSPTTSSLVKRTLRGIRRTHGTAQRQARPLTADLVRRICKPHPAYTPLQNTRDRALFLIGFAGGFRRSELASLRVSDVEIGSVGAVLTLRSSKTDQYARGRAVAVPFAKSASHCPVRALDAWLRAMARELGVNTLPATCPLFARIDKHNHLHPGLSGCSVGWLLKRRLATFGLPTAGFSAHSLRAGLVTSAAKAGVPVWAIQRQTGHKSELTVHRYIRNLDTFECNAVTSLL